MAATLPASSLRALVAGLVDYAGLFPPTTHSMSAAVAEYARHRDSRDAWMLGRFVVPVSGLDAFAAEASRLPATSGHWRLSALVGDDADADARRVRSFNDGHRARFLVEAVEAKAADAARIGEVARAFGGELEVYVELPYEPDPLALLESVRGAGARAKIRTGGVTPDAFPAPSQIARFLAACARLGVPFKATAGLHHPLRGEHQLTYTADAPSATMFGFLNVFVAAALAAAGVAEPQLAAVLEERDGSAFTFGEDGLRWRAHMLSIEHLVRTRASFALAFGSCSFREPVDDLQELALL